MSLLQAEQREVCYWRSTDQLSQETSDETNQLQDSLEENTVADMSGDQKQVEEDLPEIITHSVSEEIKRFQEEINKVAKENVKYPTWKQQRRGAKQTGESQGNVKETEKGLDKFEPPEQPKKRKDNKKVSVKITTYGDNGGGTNAISTNIHILYIYIPSSHKFTKITGG